MSFFSTLTIPFPTLNYRARPSHNHRPLTINTLPPSSHYPYTLTAHTPPSPLCRYPSTLTALTPLPLHPHRPHTTTALTPLPLHHPPSPPLGRYPHTLGLAFHFAPCVSPEGISRGRQSPVFFALCQRHVLRLDGTNSWVMARCSFERRTDPDSCAVESVINSWQDVHLNNAQIPTHALRSVIKSWVVARSLISATQYTR